MSNGGLKLAQAPQVDVDQKLKSLLKRVPTATLAVSSEGGKRIQIELEKEPEKAQAYGKIWGELVSDIASIVKSNLAGLSGKKLEEHFITEVWGVMKSNLHIQYGKSKLGFLHESLQTGKYDCDTSAFLVYDVAKQLKIKVEMIAVPEHTLVKTDNFFFETTLGKYYSLRLLSFAYPVPRVLNEEQIQSITYYNRGIAYSKQGDYKQAIEDYSTAIKLNLKLAGTYYNRGIAYFKQGDYKQAIEDYSTAIKLDPKLAEAYNDRGVAYFEQGKYKQAIEDFTKAIKLNQKYASAYNNRGIAYSKQGNYEQAIEVYSTAIKLNLKLAETYNNRGVAYFEQGNYKQAIEDYSTAIKLNPKLAEAYNNRGIAYTKMGMEELAKKDFEMYHQLIGTH